MIIKTSRFNYNGPNRVDITVKAKSIFSPTWDIVRDLKTHKINEEEYKEKYLELMRESFKQNRQKWIEFLNQEEVVLVCYCKSFEFCHRFVLADCLMKVGRSLGVKVISGGEIM